MPLLSFTLSFYIISEVLNFLFFRINKIFRFITPYHLTKISIKSSLHRVVLSSLILNKNDNEKV